MSRSPVACCLILSLFMLSCSGLEVSSVTYPQAQGGIPRTYDWLKVSFVTHGPGVNDPNLDRTLREKIENELNNRGLRRVGRQPSMLITYWIASYQTEVDGERIDTGSLVVTMLNRRSSAPLWKGTVKAELHLDSSPEEREARLDQALTALFDELPPPLLD